MTLIELKRKYPSCYYDEDMNTICIDVNEEPQTIAEDAMELIEEAFDGEKMDCFTSSGNPEDIIEVAVTGKEYIEEFFGGDYSHAFDNI